MAPSQIGLRFPAAAGSCPCPGPRLADRHGEVVYAHGRQLLFQSAESADRRILSRSGSAADGRERDTEKDRIDRTRRKSHPKHGLVAGTRANQTVARKKYFSAGRVRGGWAGRT